MSDTGDTGDVLDTDTSRTNGTEEAVALSTAEAARVAGVSARTIRRWLEKGTLPAVTGAGGVLYVFPQDLEAARIASGSRPSPVVRDRKDSGDMSLSGTVRDDRDIAEDAGHVRDTLPVAVSPAARLQLEAIRDEWLVPFVAQIREQAEQVGALRTERDRALQVRDAALAEVERLKAAQDAPRVSPQPQHGAQPADTASESGYLCAVVALLGALAVTTDGVLKARAVLTCYGIDPEADSDDLTALLEARGQSPQWSGQATLAAPLGSPVFLHAAHISIKGPNEQEVLLRILARVLEKEQAP